MHIGYIYVDLSMYIYIYVCVFAVVVRFNIHIIIFFWKLTVGAAGTRTTPTNSIFVRESCVKSAPTNSIRKGSWCFELPLQIHL